MESLVSVNWLKEHLFDQELKVFDCTNFAAFSPENNSNKTITGYNFWVQEHIAGSNYIEFKSGVTGDDAQYRNTLPAPEKFAKAMEELGIGNDSKVILYDTEFSMWAARVWWMLRWIGFDNAAILDGGFSSWKSKGGVVTNDLPNNKTTSLGLYTRAELFIDKIAMKKALDSGSVLIIDALSEAQFNGCESNLGLCGHLPGAINIPATSLMDPVTRQFLTPEQLSKLFPQHRDIKTVIYCGSGIAAATNAFIMNRLGFSDVAIYMPGLQEWVQDKGLPLINGDAFKRGSASI